MKVVVSGLPGVGSGAAMERTELLRQLTSRAFPVPSSHEPQILNVNQRPFLSFFPRVSRNKGTSPSGLKFFPCAVLTSQQAMPANGARKALPIFHSAHTV
jgi:hypothetical protein